MDDAPIDVPVPWSRRLTERHWVRIDALVALLVGAASLAAVIVAGTRAEHPLAPSGAGWDAVRAAAVAVACVALPFRRRRPMVVLGAATSATVLLVMIGFRGPVQVTVPVAMFTVATRTDRRTSLTTLGIVMLALAVAGLAAVGGPGFGNAVSGAAFALVGWLGGENARSRRVYANAVAERAVERERQRESELRRAAADERIRIARELHDVVAHAMSVIAVRSGVARAVLANRPEEAGEALAIIEQTSRQALQELRHLVGVLRQDEDAPADLAPSPTLADLNGLVSQVGQAGIEVDLVVEGEPRRLTAGVDVSAYRIVQEALTNVVRHGDTSSAHLRVRYLPSLIELEVTNETGPAAGGSGRAGGNGAGGHGLVGMRERVALYGGQLEAGPTRTGFRVIARLPTEDARP